MHAQLLAPQLYTNHTHYHPSQHTPQYICAGSILYLHPHLEARGQQCLHLACYARGHPHGTRVHCNLRSMRTSMAVLKQHNTAAAAAASCLCHCCCWCLMHCRSVCCCHCCCWCHCIPWCSHCCCCCCCICNWCVLCVVWCDCCAQQHQQQPHSCRGQRLRGEGWVCVKHGRRDCTACGNNKCERQQTDAVMQVLKTQLAKSVWGHTHSTLANTRHVQPSVHPPETCSTQTGDTMHAALLLPLLLLLIHVACTHTHLYETTVLTLQLPLHPTPAA